MADSDDHSGESCTNRDLKIPGLGSNLKTRQEVSLKSTTVTPTTRDTGPRRSNERNVHKSDKSNEIRGDVPAARKTRNINNPFLRVTAMRRLPRDGWHQPQYRRGKSSNAAISVREGRLSHAASIFLVFLCFASPLPRDINFQSPNHNCHLRRENMPSIFLGRPRKISGRASRGKASKDRFSGFCCRRGEVFRRIYI